MNIKCRPTSISALLTAAILCSQAIAIPRSNIKTTTYTYKTVGDLKIRADVLRPDDEVVRPVVVRIHGGALINGNREGSDPLTNLLLEAGYAVVTIDYRLAPETKLPEIITDVEDAFRWVRREGATLANLETSKMAVIGNSAGGYLTLATGYRIEPRPTVLVSIYGYGDLIGDWYSKPISHASYYKQTMTDREAEELAAGPEISSNHQREGNGKVFYLYCRQHGLWPKYVGGFDPHTEADKFTPYMPVKNVTKEFPPTVLVHGQKDKDVPHEQSVMMAEQFKQHGVPYLLLSVENAGHGLNGATKSDKNRAFQKAFEFVQEHMQSR